MTRSCHARPPNNTPLFLARVFARLMEFLGESSDSGCNPGLNDEAKLAFFQAGPERFSGERLEAVPDSRSGLITGDFDS